MNSSNDMQSPDSMAQRIAEFVGQSSGLKVEVCTQERMQIHQKTDGKKLGFALTNLEEVMPRVDGDGQTFLQVNFRDGKKILITDNLVGFKPQPTAGLDMTRLPKVVTTPDLQSVLEAIQESLSAENPPSEEIDVLRKVFDAVLRGGEMVGFSLEKERHFLKRTAAAGLKGCA